MNKLLGMTAVAALLAGCADKVEEEIVPTNETVGVVIGTGGDPTDPVDIVSDVDIRNGVITIGAVEDSTYDGDVLRVQVALDGPDALQTYLLVDDGRLDGFEEYSFSISAENREYTALAGRTPNGELVAVVAMDNGQFNRYFGGSQVIQQTAYTEPTSGTASYDGNYVGLINVSTSSTPVGVTGIDVLTQTLPTQRSRAICEIALQL